MNVNDVKLSNEETNTKQDRLLLIFEEQKRLMEKYHGIEEKNGAAVIHEYPFDLDSRKAQIRLKDMAWRITEELGEATQALEIHPDIIEHHQEELMDGLHFYVELLIVSGIPHTMVLTGDETMDYLHNELDYLESLYAINFKHIYAVGDTYDTALSTNKGNQVAMNMGAYEVIQHLSNAMNCLKNKPWKATHMTTDKHKFNHSVISGFRSLLRLIGECGMSPQDCFEMYLKKNRVNQFRQRSQY
jgi:hypothetical protein